ncbi:MAG: N-acetyltransferase [Sphingobium sp.]|nr:MULTISPECIES: GNAT family N-acetyltransferase [Sphingobium]MBU0658503.1 GNAT family N-acetyltransferase [Alphaproteobacteria bacterium]MBA4753784.1 GNAT family N-acetyltransferase [Sphingobium sp.]MBU0775656.1 GNAT family N-acetyltransferase [Alphaproteobacteria bacterium]MBU0869607.1 GNAT family N-acetyltransferase [Alphaproteobacteria bacterium]MBU1257388.1 GNAT family N-acetyltransferase [Alphaproteobacteria bacterium]|tara:strand:+ start:1346 stop:1921 length:576 start_codon:yes stop_codon:yes gene_type:complete
MFARTPRLLLRPGWMEDAPALAQAIGDPAVLRNLTRVPSPYGLEDALAFLERPQDVHLPSLLAFTRTHGAPRLVGGCGITRADDGGHELGYWIARPYWGLGFATEAAQAVLRMARANGVSGIRAVHFADNGASGNVLRKLGFRQTGRVEPRFSPARGDTAPCLILEEGGVARRGDDPAMDLYADAMPAMAA